MFCCCSFIQTEQFLTQLTPTQVACDDSGLTTAYRTTTPMLIAVCIHRLVKKKKSMCVSTNTVYQHRQQKLGRLCLNIQNSVLALSLIRIFSVYIKLNTLKAYSLKLNFHQLKIWHIVNSIQN